MPQKDFPDYHTMKDFHKMLEKDFHFSEEFVFRRKPRIMIPAPMKSISWEDMDGMLQNIKLSRFHSVSSARKHEKNNELFVKHLGRGGVLQISRNRVYCKLITIIQCHSHACTLINERIKLFSECSPAISLLSYCNFNCPSRSTC